ncbi:MAG: GGDEF domain-containing protein [Caryophanon sp.]|nr:GGDEF domain-containing protein [Caryophanon sp.]
MSINLNERLREEVERLLKIGQYEQVLPLLRELAAYYKACEDYENFVRVKILMIVCYFNLERVRFVDEHISDIEPYEAFLTLADRHRFYMAQATLFYFWHDFDQCIEMYKKCIKIAEQLPNTAMLTTASNFASIYRDLERYNEGFAVLERGMEKAKQLDSTNSYVQYSTAEVYLGYIAHYCLVKQFDKADAYLQELEALNYLQPQAAQMNTFKRWKAIILYEKGLIDEAFTLFDSQFKVMKNQGEYRLHKVHLKIWIDYAAKEGRYKEAYEFATVLNESLEANLEEALLDRSSKYAAELKTKDLRNLAFEDPLTSLNNRRLLTKLEKELADAPQTVTVAVLDIDHFKQINDTYGHAVGDDIIIEVAHLIQRTMHHAQHHCIRFGGDEFIIVMYRPLDQAAAWVERLHETLQSTPLRLDEHTLQITCSIGVASVSQASELTTATKLADDNLYKAKDRGRNNIVGL